MNEREKRDFQAGLEQEVDAFLRGETTRRTFITRFGQMTGMLAVSGPLLASMTEWALAQQALELADPASPLGQAQAAAMTASSEGPADGSAFRAVEADTGKDALCVTYWMNRLQNLDRRHPVFLTLNPTREPRPSQMLRSYDYAHPLFNQDALSAQKHLWQLQGRRGTWFCGSYFGYGFHEDGLQSGLAVAENFGVTRPWARPANRIAEAPLLREAAE